MPIEGRTLWEAGRAFCEHLNRLLATTVTQARLVPVARRDAARIFVAFRSRGGGPTAALLRTRFGLVALSVGQLCEALPTADGGQRLITVEYRYALTPGKLDEAMQREPLLRWEYVRDAPDEARWCRHHLQGPVRLQIGRAGLSLNDLHLPTGYVTIEEVLRFCIVDLGVRPLSPRWHRLLQESHQRFKDDFA